MSNFLSKSPHPDTYSLKRLYLGRFGGCRGENGRRKVGEEYSSFGFIIMFNAIIQKLK